MSTNLKTKTKESLISVLPITIFVLLLHFSIAPLPVDILYQFLSGAILLIAGMTLFSLGVELVNGAYGRAYRCETRGKKKFDFFDCRLPRYWDYDYHC